MALVQAKEGFSGSHEETGVETIDGKEKKVKVRVPFVVNAGDTFEADDPIVKAYPGYFGQPTKQRRRVRQVEQATAAPGEKRAV